MTSDSNPPAEKDARWQVRLWVDGALGWIAESLEVLMIFIIALSPLLFLLIAEAGK